MADWCITCGIRPARSASGTCGFCASVLFPTISPINDTGELHRIRIEAEIKKARLDAQESQRLHDEIDRLRAENAKQIMCSECGFIWVSPSQGEDDCQRCENEALKAKLARVQQFIDGHDRVVGRKPGYLRHYDKCDHGQYGYENCADCTDQVLFQALAGEEG